MVTDYTEFAGLSPLTALALYMDWGRKAYHLQFFSSLIIIFKTVGHRPLLAT